MGSPSWDGLASGPWSFLAAFSRSVSRPPPLLLLPPLPGVGDDCDWDPASSGLGIWSLASALRLIGSPSWDGFAFGPWRDFEAFSRRVSPWLLAVLLSRSDSVGVRSRSGFLLDAMVNGCKREYEM